MTKRVTRVLCAASPRGSRQAIERLHEIADDRDAHAIVVVGDLGIGELRRESYRALFRALAGDRRPAYWVPGSQDAPIGDYLRETHNIEVVHPFVRGVHGTPAFTPGGHILVAGLGGEISDDPEAPREEIERLRYPRWEAAYRLKLLAEFGEHERLLAFATPPAHKGTGEPGSEVVTELVATWRPRIVVCPGPRPPEMIGRSLVVAPGSLADGHFAVADVGSRDVDFGQLAAA
jgi:Icc-related predicted phosphoesterase